VIISFERLEDDLGRGSDQPRRAPACAFGAKYGYSTELAAAAPAKCAEIIATFARQLANQQAGSRYLVGDRLSAADMYWAAFVAIIKPLPDDMSTMLPRMRVLYDCKDSRVLGATTPQLLAHRDSSIANISSCRSISSRWRVPQYEDFFQMPRRSITAICRSITSRRY
jgi:hypothetical protein